MEAVTLLHDSFKYQVDYSQPKTGNNHHGKLARNFAEKIISDPMVLDLVEFHDEAYNAWSVGNKTGDWTAAETRVAKLNEIFRDSIPLYYYFFLCDPGIPGKNQEPLRWFESQRMLKELTLLY